MLAEGVPLAEPEACRLLDAELVWVSYAKAEAEAEVEGDPLPEGLGDDELLLEAELDADEEGVSVPDPVAEAG